MQALTRRVLPNQASQVAERAVGAKVALAALPVVLPMLFILLVLVAVVGGVAGEANAEGCLGGSSKSVGQNGAAPVALSGPPKELIPIYQEASTKVGLNPEGPAILAAINFVETDFGKNLGTSSAGAVGWMQFEPSTWEEPGIGEGGDPDNPEDAIPAAARLLKREGAPGDWNHALLAYNPAQWYVNLVEADARKFIADVPPAGGFTRGTEGEEGGHAAPGAGAAGSPQTAGSIETVACVAETGSESTVPGESAKLGSNGLVSPPAQAPQQVKAMIEAGNKIAGLPYVWAGHHALGSPVNGYDCSSAASFVMFAGGLLPAGSAGFQNGDFWTSFVAANFEAGGSVGLVPGPGKWVTAYTNEFGEHVYLTIAGVRFDDSSHLRNGAGPDGGNISMWQPLWQNTGFTPSHPQGF
jgi:hypothetical protein